MIAGVYRHKWFGPEIVLAYSGREYERCDFTLFLKALSISPSQLCLVKQIHGNGVFKITSLSQRTGSVEADAMVTDQKGIALGILTADCLPVFFYEPSRNVIAIAHGGWKGLRHGIIQHTVSFMVEEYSIKKCNLMVGLGPCIRSCCYEVGEEFSRYFPGAYSKKPKNEKGFVDLVKVMHEYLEQTGVRKDNVFDSGICTSCERKKFFSARADNGTQNRILSLIMIDSQHMRVHEFDEL